MHNHAVLFNWANNFDNNRRNFGIKHQVSSENHWLEKMVALRGKGWFQRIT
jgi:hypothetical protein